MKCRHRIYRGPGHAVRCAVCGKPIEAGFLYRKTEQRLGLHEQCCADIVIQYTNNAKVAK